MTHHQESAAEVGPTRLRSRQRRRIHAALKTIYGDRCYYCTRTFEPRGNRQRTLDHRYPLCRGGAHTIENLVLSCSKCNNCKGNLTWPEYQMTNTYRDRLNQALAEQRRAMKPPRPVIEVLTSLEVEVAA